MWSEFPEGFIERLKSKGVIIHIKPSEFIFYYKEGKYVISSVTEYQEVLDWLKTYD